MEQVNFLQQVFGASFAAIWLQFISVLPSILAAIVLFTVGIAVSKAVGTLVAKAAKTLYVDRAVEAAGLRSVLAKIGFRIEVSAALGLLITWFLYAVVLVATADILGLRQISDFLADLVKYIPNVIVAAVILVVGVVISNFVYTLVKETAAASQIAVAGVLAKVAQWAIIVFTVMAVLIQLRVATELIQILFAGFVFMVSLAGGIAFGLGGKDRARELLDKLR